MDVEEEDLEEEGAAKPESKEKVQTGITELEREGAHMSSQAKKINKSIIKI